MAQITSQDELNWISTEVQCFYFANFDEKVKQYLYPLFTMLKALLLTRAMKKNCF